MHWAFKADEQGETSRCDHLQRQHLLSFCQNIILSIAGCQLHFRCPSGKASLAMSHLWLGKKSRLLPEKVISNHQLQAAAVSPAESRAGPERL